MTSRIKAFDDENPHAEYNRQAKSDCQKTGVYCVASIALLILSGAMGNPTFVASIPGGRGDCNFGQLWSHNWCAYPLLLAKT